MISSLKVLPPRFSLTLARGHVASRYQSHEECLSGVTSTFHTSVSAFQENVAQTRKSISHNSTGLTTNSDARTSSIRDFDSDSSKVVGILKKKVVKYDLLDDVPTGETPKKRDYHIPQSWPRTKPHDEILHQTNKMPLGDVDLNLASQTPAATRQHNVLLDKVHSQDNSLDKKLVTPPFEKSGIMEIASDGRENSVFKGKLAGPSRRKILGSH
jgi:kinesin family protein 11